MNIDRMLAETLEDHRLSRGEKKAFRAVLEELAPDPSRLAEIRNRAFDAARKALADSRDEAVLGWLEDVVKVVEGRMREEGSAVHAEALFSPTGDCVERIKALLRSAKASADLCVYTITDDRVSREVLDAHRRGVAVRIITDDEKIEDMGSDISELRGSGISVRTDASEYQMHNKFAIFDGRTLLTGSYNWTRTAADHNQENMVISDDPRLVGPFAREFERLWEGFR